MSMARNSVITLMVAALVSSISFAADNTYNYISAPELESRLKDQQTINIIDIQVENEFTQKHIKGAEPTYAYPVKKATDRVKLDAAVKRLKSNSDPVVIVCPRGAGGARRTFDYLLEQGITFERLLILEKGQQGWTCEELTEKM